jgi:hypothetical protein
LCPARAVERVQVVVEHLRMRLSMVEGDTTCAASAANRREWKHGTYVEPSSWLKIENTAYTRA